MKGCYPFAYFLLINSLSASILFEASHTPAVQESKKLQVQILRRAQPSFANAALQHNTVRTVPSANNLRRSAALPARSALQSRFGAAALPLRRPVVARRAQDTTEDPVMDAYTNLDVARAQLRDAIAQTPSGENVSISLDLAQALSGHLQVSAEHDSTHSAASESATVQVSSTTSLEAILETRQHDDVSLRQQLADLEAHRNNLYEQGGSDEEIARLDNEISDLQIKIATTDEEIKALQVESLTAEKTAVETEIVDAHNSHADEQTLIDLEHHEAQLNADISTIESDNTIEEELDNDIHALEEREDTIAGHVGHEVEINALLRAKRALKVKANQAKVSRNHLRA